jgi:hypothetical protein
MEDAHAPQTLAALRFGEACALVTNTTRACIASVAAALVGGYKGVVRVVGGVSGAWFRG